MKISIEYCAQWHYDPQAVSLAAEIEKRFPVKVELIPSGGGVFEVRKDGQLIFSKKATGRFPTHEEVLAKIK